MKAALLSKLRLSIRGKDVSAAGAGNARDEALDLGSQLNKSSRFSYASQHRPISGTGDSKASSTFNQHTLAEQP